MEKAILGVVSSCGGGDWPPVLALASALANRGHRVLMVCDHGTAGEVKAAGLEPICLPHELDLEGFFSPVMERLLGGDEVFSAGRSNPLEEWAEKSLTVAEKLLGGFMPSSLLSSLFGLPLARRLSRQLRAPLIFVNPSFSFSDHCLKRDAGDFSPLGSLMYGYWLWPCAKEADLVIHATDWLFDGKAGNIPNNHLYSGPLFWERQAIIPDMLADPGPPWVLISLSTSVQKDDILIAKAALAALDELPLRGLLTLAPEHDQSLLGPVSEKALVSGYLPHSKVMPHCRFVVSHAGHGTVMKAIQYQKPMILVPWGRDQPGVAARAETLGVAAVVKKDKCSKDSLLAAMKRIAADNSLEREAAYHALRMKGQRVFDDACTRIEGIDKTAQQ